MLASMLAIALFVPQATGGACNDQARHKTTMAGNTSTGAANCPSFSFTITIAGQSFTFSSPTSCDIGRREQDKDCYDCGPDSEGNHCKARGFPSNVKIYSIGGDNPCPTLPASLPTTIEEANAAVACKPLPKISDEDNWCASVQTCNSGLVAAEEQEGVLVIGDGKGARSRWSGPFELEWREPASELEARLRALPRDPLDALPEALRAALGEAPPLEGAEVVGTLDLDYFRDGQPWISNRFDFSAFLTESGIHVREREFVPDEDDQFTARTEDVLHDGRMVLVGSAEVGHAYLPDYFDLAGIVRARLAPYSLLEVWLTNPFGVQRLVGTQYEAIGDARGDPTVIETYPGIGGPGADGNAVYRLGGDEAHPRFTSVEHRDRAGTLRLQRVFSAYSEVTEGAVRPGRIVENLYDVEGRIQLTRSLRLRSARALSLEEARARGWLKPRALEWLVYQ